MSCGARFLMQQQRDTKPHDHFISYVVKFDLQLRRPITGKDVFIRS